MQKMQCTVSISGLYCSGVGIHSGKSCKIIINEADEDTGIVFDKDGVRIPAIYSNIANTSYSTNLVKDNISIGTIEHLMASLYMFGITNALIKIEGDELPVLDGGSSDYLFLLKIIGRKVQSKKRKILAINREIKIEDQKDGYIIAVPSQQMSVSFDIDFDGAAIGRQFYTFVSSLDSFEHNISFAKTFAGDIKQVEYLRSIGMGLGGHLGNAIVANGNTIMNKNFLYTKDTFVRHKILDFIGDMFTSGCSVLADFKCYKSGHALNNLFILNLFSDPKNYSFI